MRNTFLSCLVSFVLLAGQAAHGAVEPEAGVTLRSRLAEPEAEVIARFEASGMREVRPHALTPSEKARAEQALAALPALQRLVLEKRLRRLSFVDGIPGNGSGLTSMVGDTGKFDITLRASLIEESLSDFLTDKERRLFTPDASGQAITVEADGADALTYVLLHEASHVLDSALGITQSRNNSFTMGIWKDRRTLVPSLTQSAAAATAFRGAAAIPVGRAATTYDALARTPFVSLYATAAAPEDFAELLAWHEVSTRFGGGLTITIRDADGAVLHRYRPLDFPAVKPRMAHVEALLRRTGDQMHRPPKP